MRCAFLYFAMVLVLSGCDDGRRSAGADLGSADVGEMGALDMDLPADAGPDFPPGTTCTPGYACPRGAVFSTVGGTGYCHWESLELPASVEPYCFYFDEGYLGFSWPIGTSPSYECPPEARRAPSSELDYCLYEDFAVPAGAAEDCADLLSERRLGFRWPCP